MSVKATAYRRPVWATPVLRDGRTFNRRRFLDCWTYFKQDAVAVEAELIAEYERARTRRTPTPTSSHPRPTYRRGPGRA